MKERGFMAIYHDIEEMNYGPTFGMPAKWRVFLCIRHKLLRDGMCEKHIGTAFIMEKTGLTKSQIKHATKSLIIDGLIISSQNVKELSNGHLVHGENSYALNPVIFGEYYNWYKNNPTVRVYEDCKTGSYSARGPVPNVTPGGVSDLAPGGVSDVTPGKGLKFLELLDKIKSNNPSSNNPRKNNPSSEDLNFSEKRKQRRKQSEDIEEEKKIQLEEAKKAGIL